MFSFAINFVPFATKNDLIALISLHLYIKHKKNTFLRRTDTDHIKQTLRNSLQNTKTAQKTLHTFTLNT